MYIWLLDDIVSSSDPSKLSNYCLKHQGKVLNFFFRSTKNFLILGSQSAVTTKVTVAPNVLVTLDNTNTVYLWNEDTIKHSNNFYLVKRVNLENVPKNVNADAIWVKHLKMS